VPGHRPIFGLGRPLADHDLRAEEVLAAPAGTSARDAQRAPGAQARSQLPLQPAAAPDIQGLVDRLVRDSHGLIIGEVCPEPARDLLRAPRPGPPPVGTPPVPPAGPPDVWPRHGHAVRPGDRAAEPVLHVLAQSLVSGQFRDLGTACPPLGMPLRRRGAVVQPPRAGGRVTSQLTRDRRRRAAQPAGDLAHARLLRVPERDVLPLGEGQETAGHGRRKVRSHPASLAKPAGPDRRRHAGLAGSILRTGAPPDSRPEPHPVLAPGHRRPARRRYLPPVQLNPPLPLPHRHKPHLHRRCCDDPLNPSRSPASGHGVHRLVQRHLAALSPRLPRPIRP
jgi:hypothetical protein